ncbi:MAG: hypothetical protein RIQ33_620 [Bacteroidota bacterium]|jgi:hypothetical protein
MDKKFITDIGNIIQSFNQSLQLHLPALENAVNELIDSKNRDERTIEYYLDALLSLTMHGVGDKLFVKLLDYYKTIDADGASFYWNEYDREEE